MQAHAALCGIAVQARRRLTPPRRRAPIRSRTPSPKPIFAILQVLYNLQWCGFSALRRWPALAEIKAKGSDFTEEDKNVVLDIHAEILAMVLGEYRAAQDRGQIELTTTPYFHPIMPLVYDTNIARRCQPQFAAALAIHRARRPCGPTSASPRNYTKNLRPTARGLWPSEGSIAPEIMPLLVEAGIEYFASDEGNLFKSLKHDLAWMNKPVDHLELFQGWRVNAGGAPIQALFRDRPLSDFVGFDAARNENARAVDHLLSHLKNIATACPDASAVTPLILDGENAWEAFADGGELFLTTFYQALADTEELRMRRMGDYFDEFPAKAETSYLHSGSWIRQ